MASGVFLNISPTQATPKHLSNIHPKRQSLKTKEVALLMGILFLISKTQKRETSMNYFLCPVSHWPHKCWLEQN